MKRIHWFTIMSAFAHVLSQPVNAEMPKNFQLSFPKQSLSSALNRLSEETGLAFIAPSGLLEERSINDLSLNGSPIDILSALIEGQNLDFDTVDENLVVIRPIKPTSIEPEMPISGAESPSDPISLKTTPLLQDTIRVNGRYNASLMSAFDRKLASDSIIEVVDAKGVSDFPAQNVAEALQKVTGISVSRDRGEALFVSIRGLPSNFQTVTMNGRSIAVNENVRDSSQNGRQFRFDTIPTELVAGVDVIKAPNAEQDEGAIGGIINVRTFKPFDLENQTFAVNLMGSYPELTETTDLRTSVLGSVKNKSETLAFLGALSFNQRSLRQDRLTLMRWRPIETTILANGPTETDTNIYLESIRPTLEQEYRERIGLNGSIQYKPDSKTMIEAEAFYVDLGVNYRETTYSAEFDETSFNPQNLVSRDQAIVEASGFATSQIGLETSDLNHDNLLLAVTFQRQLDRGQLQVLSHWTDASSQTGTPIRRTRVNGDVGRVRYRVPEFFSGLPDIVFEDTDLNQPGILAFRRIELRKQTSSDQDSALQIDYERPWQFLFFDELSAGFKVRYRVRDYDRQDLIFDDRAGVVFPANFYSDFPVKDFLSQEAGDLVRAWVQPIPNAFSTVSAFDPSFGPSTAGDLRNSYEIDEFIHSFYAGADIDTTLFEIPVRGNAGLRISYTDQTSNGHAVRDESALPVSFTTNYVDFMPNLNLVFIPSDTIQIRASIARVITRPSLADIAPRLTLNSSGTVLDAVGGNPELERYQAWQADIGLNYDGRYGMLSAGLFYKSFDQFIFEQTSDIDVDGITYTLTAPANGGRARVYGAELAWQKQFNELPAPLDGFGLQANYTIVDSRASYSETFNDDLVGVAKESYAIGGFFETDDFSLHAIYNFRGDVLRAVGNNDQFTSNDKAYGTTDLSLSYNLTDNLALRADIQNLTNEPLLEFVRGDLLAGYTHYGRTLSLGLQWRTGSLTP